MTLPLPPPLLQKLFVVPATEQQKQIPFARVNHNKYMVTDRVAYIGEPGHQCWEGAGGVDTWLLPSPGREVGVGAWSREELGARTPGFHLFLGTSLVS